VGTRLRPHLVTREIADTETAETSAIYSSVIGAFGMFLVLPFICRMR